MPLTLDIAEVVSKTIDTLEINSFAVDIERGEIHVGYDKGHVDTGLFVPDMRDQLLTIDGPGFMAAIVAADSYANAMLVGQVSVYGALKLALYDQISVSTGLTGTVA